MDYFLHILTYTAMTIPSTLGLNLVLGKGKILHFGSMGPSIIGAYSFLLMTQASGSAVIGILGAFALVSVFSLLLAWLSLRLDDDAFGILSIAVHLAVLAVVLNWPDLTRGALGISRIARFPGLESQEAFATVAVLVAVVYIFFMYRIHRSSFGRELSALAENRYHAESLGISRTRVHVIAFLIAGTGALIGNILYPQYIGLLHPADYGFPALIFLIMCIVAGRPGSVLGVTLATALLILLKEGIRFLPLPLGIVGPVRLMLFGIILIVAVYVRRKELFPKPRTI